MLTPRPRRAAARFAVALAAAALLLLYAVQVIVAGRSDAEGDRTIYDALMIATGLLETVALYVLYRALARASAQANALLFVAMGGLLLLSLICVNTDIDASAYIAYAKLANFHDAYRPPAVTFAGDFAKINGQWPGRLPALDYGPLWLLIDRVTVGLAPSYAAALLILRACNVVFLIALLVALRRLGFARPLVAVVALNPMLWFYYVVQAHNDLLAILLVVAGAAVARRRPLLGALLAGTAGLIKITFVAIAVLAYAGRRKPRTTIAYGALATLSCVLVSAAFGGADYLHAMFAAGHEQIANRADLFHAVGVTFHVVAALVAAGALLWAVFGGKFTWPATYAFSAISTIFYPWYLGWCIPYALRIPDFVPWFFIVLPALAHALDPHFSLYKAHTFAVLVPYYAVIIGLTARQVWLSSRGRAATASAA